MKNYELLGIHIDRPEEFPDRLRELDEVRLRVKSAPLWTYHRSYILTLLEYPCWEQMGYIDIPKLPQRLEDG